MHMPLRRAHDPSPLDRRKALQIGGAGLLGLNMPRVLASAALLVPSSRARSM